MTLTTAEFDLLLLLAMHAGTVVDRDMMSLHLRGCLLEALDRSMDARVSRRRRSIGDTTTPPGRIMTVRGRGYLMVPEPG